VSDYDQIIKQLISAVPSWEKDGGGIRGRAIAPLISGASTSNGIGQATQQQFKKEGSQVLRRSSEPLPDLFLSSLSESIPDGIKLGDIIYWETEQPEYWNEEEDGEWEPQWLVLTAPDPDAENPKYIKFKEELEWVDAIPDGTENNQMLVWNGEKWTILSAPSSGTDLDPSFLQYKGGSSLVWDEGKTLPNGSNFGDLLYWDPEAGEGGAWVTVDAAGAQEGSILIWGEDGWSILNNPPNGDLHVLTNQDGDVYWTPTQDCETE
jgi:hypothetical protein